jgi:hypothetical protein
MSLRALDVLDMTENPLDVVEQVVTAHQWEFDRQGDGDLSVCVAGSWCDYHIGFTYLDASGALQVACAYDMRVADRKRSEICQLLALINERMWFGHFDLWADEAIPMFRQGLLVRGGLAPTSEQIERVIEIAIGESERYYPAFQFVLWGGKTAEEAIAAAMLETVGEA